MKISCPSCEEATAIVMTDYEGGAGSPYYEYWTCESCGDYWDEVYLLVEDEEEE